KDEIPVSTLHVCDRVHSVLSKLCVSQRKIFARNLNLAARLIDPESTPQRLCVTEHERRRKLRIERGELVIRGQLDRREMQTGCAAKFRLLAFEARVGGLIGVVCRGALTS